MCGVVLLEADANLGLIHMDKSANQQVFCGYLWPGAQVFASKANHLSMYRLFLQLVAWVVDGPKVTF